MSRFVLCILLLSAGLASAQYRDTFAIDKGRLNPFGHSQYFVLIPGYEAKYQHEKQMVICKVLNETKVFDNVMSGVVERRETEAGELVKITREYCAIDSVTKDVYLFGKDVDTYGKGKVAGHKVSWLSGVNGAKFGLIVPGSPKSGDQYYEEQVRDVAMDRANIVAIDDTVTVPTGTYTDALRVVNTTPLDKDARSRKWYAPGIGLIKWNDFELVKVKVPKIAKEKVPDAKPVVKPVAKKKKGMNDFIY